MALLGGVHYRKYDQFSAEFPAACGGNFLLKLYGFIHTMIGPHSDFDSDVNVLIQSIWGLRLNLEHQLGAKKAGKILVCMLK